MNPFSFRNMVSKKTCLKYFKGKHVIFIVPSNFEEYFIRLTNVLFRIIRIAQIALFQTFDVRIQINCLYTNSWKIFFFSILEWCYLLKYNYNLKNNQINLMVIVQNYCYYSFTDEFSFCLNSLLTIFSKFIAIAFILTFREPESRYIRLSRKIIILRERHMSSASLGR